MFIILFTEGYENIFKIQFSIIYKNWVYIYIKMSISDYEGYATCVYKSNILCSRAFACGYKFPRKVNSVRICL